MILKNSYLGLIVFLLPLSFIIGTAVTETFLFLSILLFIFINREKNFYIDIKIIFLFVFALYVALNSYFLITDQYGKDLKLSSYLYFRFILFSLSIFFLCTCLDQGKHKVFHMLFSFVISVLLFDAIFQFFYGINILGFVVDTSGRVSSFFQDELILGSFLVKLLPIFMWSLFFFKINLKNNFLLLIIFFSLYFISIYISGGRTSFFLLLFLIFSFLILIKNIRLILSYSLLILIIFAICIKFFNLGSVDTSHRIFTKTFEQMTEFNSVTENSDKDKMKSIELLKGIRIFSDDHEGHIKLALKLFSENKIFGIGPKGFRHYCRQVNYDPDYGICSTHPHNTIIQIISELGLVGLIFYFFALTFILFHLLNLVRKNFFNDDCLAFYSITLGLLVNLFPFIPSGNFFNNWISIVLYYNFGIYLFSYKKCILK